MEQHETNITNIAYNKIKEMIRLEKLKPGEKINKRIISETLGFSSTPVTLALKKLLGEGIIEYKTRIGYFVKIITKKELIELFELRAALEGMAIRIVAEKCFVDEIHDICTFWDNYKDTTEKDYIKTDSLFHKKIVQYSKNDNLISIWNNIGFNGKSNQTGLKNTIEGSKSDHKKIIEALSKRNGEKAQIAMINHFMHAVTFVQKNIS